MKFERAAERGDGDGNRTGVWDYIRQNSDGTGARRLGYCAGLPPTSTDEIDEQWGANAPDWDDTDSWETQEALERIERNKKRVQRFGHKYHDDGHSSKEEAQECYGEYLFDHRLEQLVDPAEYELNDVNQVTPGTRVRECEQDGCQKRLTSYTAELQVQYGAEFTFCSGHQTDENLLQACIEYARAESMIF